MNLAEAEALVRSADLPAGDFAVFGSGPLLVRKIITDVNDVDILARGPAWEKALRIGELVSLPELNVSVVSLHDGALTIGAEWAIGDIDVNEAIDGADIISGLPWVQLDLVAEYKRAAARPKDLDHLRLLAAWFEPGEGNPSTSLER